LKRSPIHTWMASTCVDKWLAGDAGLSSLWAFIGHTDPAELMTAFDQRVDLMDQDFPFWRRWRKRRVHWLSVQDSRQYEPDLQGYALFLIHHP
jgi:hypothetical protein